MIGTNYEVHFRTSSDLFSVRARIHCILFHFIYCGKIIMRHAKANYELGYELQKLKNVIYGFFFFFNVQCFNDL